MRRALIQGNASLELMERKKRFLFIDHEISQGAPILKRMRVQNMSLIAYLKLGTIVVISWLGVLAFIAVIESTHFR